VTPFAPTHPAASIEEAVTTRIMRGRETEPVKVEKPEQIEMPVQSAEIMRFRKPIANKPKATIRKKWKLRRSS
jgi:hypothetical protein